MDYFTNKKSLIKGLIISLAVLLFGAFIYSLSPGDSNGNTTARDESLTQTDQLRAERVFVKDFHTLTEHIKVKDWYAIERRLYTNVVEVSGNQPDLYTGIVRQDSLSRTLLPTSYSVKVLIDVLPARLTYQVAVVESRNTPVLSRSIYISCAEKELQIKNYSTCRQGAV